MWTIYFLVDQILLTKKILFFFRLYTGISKIQRGLYMYRQSYTTVYTVREHNGGSQPHSYSSFSFIFSLAPSLISLVFRFSSAFIWHIHFLCITITCDKWSPCLCFAKVPSTPRRRCFAVVLMQIYLYFWYVHSFSISNRTICLFVSMSCCIWYCRGRAVTNVVRNCSPTLLYIKAIKCV